MALGFWRIAMRPGKPLMHGALGDMLVLGLPGNPTSSMVCALLFLRPLLRALHGEPDAGADPSRPARLGADVGANGPRQDYMRATLAPGVDGVPIATPVALQDFVARQGDGARRRPHRAADRRPARKGRRGVPGDCVRRTRDLERTDHERRSSLLRPPPA